MSTEWSAVSPQPSEELRHTRGSGRIRHVAAAVFAICVLATSCADFSAEPVAFSEQPTLTPVEPTPVLPDGQAVPPSGSGQEPPSSETATTPPADPCVPTDPAVVAACLAAPWGLAVLPNGTSALVGERTSGRILLVTATTGQSPRRPPTEVATIADLDSSGDGGLLGIALSPSYTEDNQVFLYVTTKTDNRILRMVIGEEPKTIFTGIPKADNHNGGRIAFGRDGFLYIATGDAGTPTLSSDPESLAGKILRIDAFGNPVGDDEKDNPHQSAVYASGLVNPTGLCLLPTGQIGVIEPKRSKDLLIPVNSGANLKKAKQLWAYPHADGGAVDCTANAAVITATSLSGKLATSLTLTESGAFKGSPTVQVKDQYGRLLTATTGPQNLIWMTTSNKDGQGEPTDADDRVIIMPSSSEGGSGGVE